MNYGFVIDNQRCIGCHACSTACKSENEVPLGVYRTWVKYTETGRYPDTQRHFQVTRCNHCSNPPCVRICPTQAMYQRDDGIVEFDSSACIGCKGCMQACPYDAVHIDPSSGTAAKCHYCSHRVDVGLEPSCVVVCPTHAIIAGDMDDPTSEISRTLARKKVTVLKPEQGTAPKLFYIDGSDVNMHPTATAQGDTFMWADALKKDTIGGGYAESKSLLRSGNSNCNSSCKTSGGVDLRTPQAQGLPESGAINLGGTRAEQMVQVGYNAQHKVPWHWPVPAYLVTKGIAAGIFILFAFAQILGTLCLTPLAGVVFSSLTVFFLGLTTVLLVYDLEKPSRFLYILMRPQWRSWLTRGAVFLIGFSTIASAWAGAEIITYLNWQDMAFLESARLGLFVVGIPLAVMTAIYTAFLFGQAEGRDFWQSPLLPMHLLIQALMMGCAGVLLMSLAHLISPELTTIVRWAFVIFILLDIFVTMTGEFAMPHASDSAAQAAHAISHGKYKLHFWVGSLLVGHLFPLALIGLAFTPLTATASALCCIVGLYCYEHAFVMAPQEIPNS